MERLTVGTLLEQAALAHGEREAVVFCDRDQRWTYRETQRQVHRLAKGLMGLGVGGGEHVAAWAPERPEWLMLQLATAKIGAVLLTVDPDTDADGLASVLAHSDATTLFLPDRSGDVPCLDRLAACCPELARARPGRLASRALPELKRVILFPGASAPGTLAWDAVLSAGGGISDHLLRRRDEAVDPGDTASLHYTAGTTGAPKGVMLSHRNLVASARRVAACVRLARDDRLGAPVPSTRLLATLGMLAAIDRAASLVVPAAVHDPDAVLAAVAAERCTVLYGDPATFGALLAHPRRATLDPRALRTGVITGGPCPPRLVRGVAEALHARAITVGYGLTEASGAVTQTRPEDPLELGAASVGRPLAGVEVRIVDPTSGDEVPRGRPGELWCRGDLVMRGYYKPSDPPPAAVDAYGWLHTGDLATMDQHGYCRLTGRVRDLVVRGGETIHPREVEDHLTAHPKIGGAQVFGVPDTRLGEELAAWIQLRDGAAASAEEIRDFCRGVIAPHKIPHYIRFVRDVPRSATGEVQRFKLRQTLARELGLARVR